MEGWGRGAAWLLQSVSALGDSWTASHLLACGGQPCYRSHKVQILWLEHDQRLWDLSRREADSHSPLNVGQKTPWMDTSIGQSLILQWQ